MTSLITVAAIVLLVLPGLPVPLGSMPPSERARISLLAIRAGFGALRLGLLLGATPTLLRAVGVEHLAARCHEVLGSVAPGGTVTGWASAVAFAAVTLKTRAVRAAAAAAQRQARVEPWLGAHRQVGDVDVVVLPTEETLAYAVPGVPPQVVVTAGLQAVLTEAELDAVIAHERSHIDHDHHRAIARLTIVADVMGWFPGVRRSAACARLAIERWADEDASAASNRAVVRGALLKTTAALVGPVPAFTGTSSVPDRLRALGEPAPDRRASSYAMLMAPVVSLTIAVAALSTRSAAFAYHSALGLAGYCPV